MNLWLKTMLGAAMIAGAASTASAHAMASAHGMATASGRPRPVHISHPFSTHPFRFGFHPHVFVLAFPNERFGRARFEGWSGGAYSSDVAAYDDSEDEDSGGEDMHFRVQDRFGPGDIGRPTPPEPPRDDGAWDGQRLDPWHGYEPEE
jgi:hypothetical protein